MPLHFRGDEGVRPLRVLRSLCIALHTGSLLWLARVDLRSVFGAPRFTRVRLCALDDSTTCAVTSVVQKKAAPSREELERLFEAEQVALSGGPALPVAGKEQLLRPL